MEVGPIPSIRLVPTDNTTRADRDLSGVFATEFRKRERDDESSSRQENPSRESEQELPQDEVILESASSAHISAEETTPDDTDSASGISIFA